MRIYKDNITNRNKIFEELVVKSQAEMRKHVIQKLKEYGGKLHHGDGFVYHKGKFPVLLCAHMDTVHKQSIKTMVYANGTLSSPQGIGGDDRCGIYMIFEILKEYDCHVVFLEDEEIGCIGAKKFIKTKLCKSLKDADLKYIIEFDRKGNNHAVTYDCDNKEFDDFITKEFFKKEYGTCSDISYIAPTIGVAAVNLSCGYYKEHNIEEWVNLAEMERVIIEAKELLKRTKELKTPFKYIEGLKRNYGWGYGYGGYNDWWGDDDYYYNRNYSSLGTTNIKKCFKFVYKDARDRITSQSIYAKDYTNSLLEFFTKHPTLRIEDILSINEGGK